MQDVKVTAKSVWLPAGVVISIIAATILMTKDYYQTKALAISAAELSQKNEVEIRSLKEGVIDRLGRIETNVSIIAERLGQYDIKISQ